MSGGVWTARALRRVFPLEAPVSVAVFAGAVGLEIAEGELLAGVLAVSVHVSGAGRRGVVLQRGLGAAEQRLALLHAGGHMVLGDRQTCVFLSEHERLWRFPRERAACEFAVTYGIPDELLVGFAWDDLAGVARSAGLPLGAVELRRGLAPELVGAGRGPWVRPLRRLMASAEDVGVGE